MTGKRYLAAVSVVVLGVGSLGRVPSSADDQHPASRIYSSTGSWRFGSEHRSYLLPAALPFTEFVLAEAELDSTAIGAAIATCLSGSIVGGGGYAANMDVAVYTQHKYENGWRGDATNNSIWKQTLRIYDVCLHNVSGASVTQVHGEVRVDPGQKGQAIATCPAGSIATRGGFFAFPDRSLRVYNSSPSDGGERWQSWAENMSGSSKTHHAYAVCLSGSEGEAESILESVTVSPQSWPLLYLRVTAGGSSRVVVLPRKMISSFSQTRGRFVAMSGGWLVGTSISARIGSSMATPSASGCQSCRRHSTYTYPLLRPTDARVRSCMGPHAMPQLVIYYTGQYLAVPNSSWCSTDATTQVTTSSHDCQAIELGVIVTCPVYLNSSQLRHGRKWAMEQTRGLEA